MGGGGGPPTSKRTANLLFGKTFAENYMKLKETGSRGVTYPWCPTWFWGIGGGKGEKEVT